MSGDRGRNRLYISAVALQICLTLLAIQALPTLSGPVIFKLFCVRFGVRLVALLRRRQSNEPSSFFDSLAANNFGCKLAARVASWRRSFREFAPLLFNN